MKEEFVPTFEEPKKNLIVAIDEFEEQIEVINELTKEYDDLKKKIKQQMVDIGKENDLEQVKWTTPKGIQITCSIGKKAEFEEQEFEEFYMEGFKNENPELYKKYLIKNKKQVAITNGSYDRLVITLPKEKNNYE